MIKQKVYENQYERMTQAPIAKLISTLSVPSIISMVITSVYNMTDAFFIGKIGTSATGAIGVAFSLMALIQAIGFTVGMGSGNNVARSLGQKDEKEASRYATTGFLVSIIFGLLFSVLGYIFIVPITKLLGATDTILPYAIEYLKYILVGAPLMTGTFVLNNLFKFQGNSFFSMIGISAGAFLNMILDPIFIFVFDMGIKGAAITTIIGQAVSFFILLIYYFKRKDHVKIKFSNFSFNPKIYLNIFLIGLPSLLRQGMASISGICLNWAAVPFGDAAIAAMTIVTKIFMFCYSIVVGLGQGFQPVCAFNYSAKKYDRVIKAFWFSVKASAVILVILGVFVYLFAPQLVTAFRGDAEVIKIGAPAMQFQAIVFPLSAWVVILNMLTQTIGKHFEASVLSIARQGLFFIPAVLILPLVFGVTGIQLSQPVSDIATFALAVPLGLRVIKELRKLKEMAPENDEEIVAEVDLNTLISDD